MKIPCIRCGKEIDTPNASNADYIRAEDTVVTEERDVFYALRKGGKALGKIEKQILKDKPDATEDYINSKLADSDLEEVRTVDAKGLAGIPDIVRVKVRKEPVRVAKTGIICPDCYRPTDFVIWGVHRG